MDFRYRGIRCREQTTLTDTPANRKQLQTVLDRITAELTLGTFEYVRYFPNSVQVDRFKVTTGQLGQFPLFQDFVPVWLEQKSPEWRRSHIVCVRSMLRGRLLPAFGEKPVNTITKAEILGFRATMATGDGHTKLSPITVNHAMFLLHMILGAASEQYGFPTPYSGIKSLKVPRKDISPFTLDEVRLILSNVREDFRNYYTVRFFTGMRPGEIHGLKWTCVDFERRQILVRETWTGGYVEYTKNDGSQREIHMSGMVYQALQDQFETTGKHDYVFVTDQGTPLNGVNITQRVWYPLLRYLNLNKRVSYQTRHTAATLWLAAGENPEWIARQMGHTTTEMLFRVYSRFVPNLTRRDGSAFEKLLETHRPTSGEPAP